MYSSYNSNIKCVGLTIKYIDFELIHCVINLDVVSLFMVFSDFDYMFLSMYCYFESIKLFFSSKKIVNKSSAFELVKAYHNAKSTKN